MKCEDCKPEVNEWVKIQELKIEVQRERHSLGLAFKDIVVPKGLRLLTKKEILWLYESEYAEQLGLMMLKTGYWEEYIEQFIPENKGKTAAWFGCGSINLNLDGDDDLYGYGAGRGVRFVTDEVNANE